MKDYGGDLYLDKVTILKNAQMTVGGKCSDFSTDQFLVSCRNLTVRTLEANRLRKRRKKKMMRKMKLEKQPMKVLALQRSNHQEKQEREERETEKA